MTTSTDGARSSVGPEPEGESKPPGRGSPRRCREHQEYDDADEAVGAGPSWVLQEIQRRVAEGGSGSGGRHARRGSVLSPGSPGYVPRHSVATPGPGAPPPRPVGGSPSPRASALLRRERTAQAEEARMDGPTAWSGPLGRPAENGAVPPAGAAATQTPAPNSVPRTEAAGNGGTTAATPGISAAAAAPVAPSGPAAPPPGPSASAAPAPPGGPSRTPSPRPRPRSAAPSAPTGPSPIVLGEPATTQVTPPVPSPPADAEAAAVAPESGAEADAGRATIPVSDAVRPETAPSTAPEAAAPVTGVPGTAATETAETATVETTTPEPGTREPGTPEPGVREAWAREVWARQTGAVERTVETAPVLPRSAPRPGQDPAFLRPTPAAPVAAEPEHAAPASAAAPPAAAPPAGPTPDTAGSSRSSESSEDDHADGAAAAASTTAPPDAIEQTSPTAPVSSPVVPGSLVLSDPVFTARTPEPGSLEWQALGSQRVPEQEQRQETDSNDLQSRRVRVVLAERRGVARPVRTVVDIQEGTGVGEFLRKDLIKTQLSIALRFAGGAALTLGLLPLLFAMIPEVGRIDVLGIRLPWLLLGLLVYPFLYGIGLWHSRLAEKVEQNFADHVQD